MFSRPLQLSNPGLHIAKRSSERPRHALSHFPTGPVVGDQEDRGTSTRGSPSSRSPFASRSVAT